MTYQLICEGACNGDAVRVVDGQIRKADQERGGEGVVGDETLWAAIRRLKYTPHEMGDTQAQCVVCGHRRAYGVHAARWDMEIASLWEQFRRHRTVA